MTTNRAIAIASLRQALGYAAYRKDYDQRIAAGYEFCKRWLETNREYHNIEMDDGVLSALRSLCEKPRK